MDIKRVESLGEKKFKSLITLQDYSILVEFSFLQKRRDCGYSSGFVFAEARSKDGRTLYYKEFVLITDKDEFKTFYKSTKAFLRIVKQISNAKDVNEVLSLLSKNENKEELVCYKVEI